MDCPECSSTHVRKNGIRRDKQNHICVDCGRQFVADPQMQRGYGDDIRRECFRMYLTGMGLGGAENS